MCPNADTDATSQSHTYRSDSDSDFGTDSNADWSNTDSLDNTNMADANSIEYFNPYTDSHAFT